MKFNLKDLNEFREEAELALSNDRYDIYDLKLEHLTVSITVLHAKKETRGHSHENIEEVYMCLGGSGQIQIGEEKIPFKEKDFVTIPMGKFHRVFNNSAKDLVFMAIFEKYERV